MQRSGMATGESSSGVIAGGARSVVMRNGSVRRDGRVVWEGINLDVHPGEFVAVLGPNGVGKSTLIKVLLGLLPLAGGEVLVLGRAPKDSLREVGYLPQRRTFEPGLRIRGIDIVRLGLDGDRWGVPLPIPSRWSASKRAAAERIHGAIELVGATAFAHRPIGEMSGGEQQRLLIAQALVREPALLLLDEPLDSLDLPNQAASAALLNRVCKERHVTVLMVAHNVNPILSYLDQVVYLARGSAVSGTPEEVITAPTLSKLYGTPIEVFRTADGHLVVVGQPEAPHGDVHAHLVR